MKFTWTQSLRLAVLGVIMAVVGSGCGKGMIDRVVVTPSATLDSVKVALFFKPDVQVLLAGMIPFHDYGYIYMNPSTANQPFELGFDLKTSITGDPGYVQLTPTLYLPNGAPIGLTYPVVEVKGSEPISPNFDLYGYIDVEKRAWLGTAALFSVSKDTEIPLGLTITQIFQRDQNGAPVLFASVYGPTVDQAGAVSRAGGIAVFAKIDYLMSQLDGKSRSYVPEKDAIITQAESVKSDKLTAKKIRKFEKVMIREANRAAAHH